MSTRKSSLRLDSPQADFGNRTIELGSRTRPLEQMHATINIKLDQKLTMKLVFVKKLEKIQKQAIRLFYQGRAEECFEGLARCVCLLEDRTPGIEQGGVPEHWVYVRYLQCEFKYKAKEYSQAREFHAKAMRIISRLSKTQKQKTKQYIISLEALHCCLLYYQGKYAQSIRSIEQFQTKIQQGRHKVSEKYYKQVCLYRVQALLRIGQYRLAIKLMEKFQGSFRNISCRDETKIKCNMAIALSNIEEIGKAEEILQGLIDKLRNKQKIDESHIKSSVSDPQACSKALLSKIYTTYLSLFAPNPIKCLLIAQQWRQALPYCDQAACRLFHLYHQIGDYEQALLQYAELSQSYRKSAQDWESIAQIKAYYGQRELAEHMFGRAYQMAKGDEKKMGLELRLLEFCKEQASKQAMKMFEKRIKEHRFKTWVGPIVKKYQEYLRSIGDTSRIDKINKLVAPENLAQQSRQELVHEFLQTGKFGSMTLKNQQTMKNTRKRNSLMIPRML